MRRLGLVTLALMIAFGGPTARAQDALPESEIRTRATQGPGPQMAPYGAALHRLILNEVQRAKLPFSQFGTIDVVVQFEVDRRGKLAQFQIVQSIGGKIVDDHVEQVMRRAARRFPPPPPVMLVGDRAVFRLPFRFAVDVEPVRDGLGFPRQPLAVP